MKRRGPMTLWWTNRRFRRWTVAVVAAPFLYVLSCGPLFWWACYDMPEPIRAATIIYFVPLDFVGKYGPAPIQKALRWYIWSFRPSPWPPRK